MVQKTEEVEVVSNCSYDLASPCEEAVVDEVSSAVVSEDEDSQSIRVESGLRSTSRQSEREEETKSNSWKKDDTFFFSFVTFRVEERLFRVPRDAFENQSQYFRDLFSSKPMSIGTNATGDINEPIYLEGVEESAFRDFLRLLYPPPTSSIFAGVIFLSREQWIKVLDLGQKWGFTGIRAHAIEKLEAIKLEEVEKLELALKYEIKQWYNDACLALCERKRPLSSDEGRRLGLDLSLEIAELRECRLSRLMEESSKAPKSTSSTASKTPVSTVAADTPSASSPSNIFQFRASPAFTPKNVVPTEPQIAVSNSKHAPPTSPTFTIPPASPTFSILQASLTSPIPPTSPASSAPPPPSKVKYRPFGMKPLPRSALQRSEKGPDTSTDKTPESSVLDVDDKIRKEIEEAVKKTTASWVHK